MGRKINQWKEKREMQKKINKIDLNKNLDELLQNHPHKLVALKMIENGESDEIYYNLEK